MKLKLGKILTLSVKTAAAVGCLAFSVSVASAQEITAIDFNGDLIGKVIPDGKVVSFENQLIGNITADSLIVNFEGNLIGEIAGIDHFGVIFRQIRVFRHIAAQFVHHVGIKPAADVIRPAGGDFVSKENF